MRVSSPDSLRVNNSWNRGAGPDGLLVDDRQRQRVLGAEVEVHRALGQLRLGENVVEADGVIGTLGELVRRGSQDLLARRIGTLVGGYFAHVCRQIVVEDRAWLSARNGMGIQRDESSASIASPGRGRDNRKPCAR